jgi:predicted XRE-type DNA-binding protein
MSQPRKRAFKGSGNIFLDVGFSEEKSAELMLKSSMLQALQEMIKERGSKQPKQWLNSVLIGEGSQELILFT